MKKIVLSFTVFALSLNAFSQTNNNSPTADWNPETYQIGKMYPGYIIKLDGDTVEGFLKADHRCSIGGIGSSNQNTAAFYVNELDKKPLEKYKPEDIKGYKIADKSYESINYSGGLLKKPNFNLVVEDGAIRMYEWYSTKENYMTVTKQSGETWAQFDARRFDNKLIIAKNPTEPIEFSTLGMSFAKKMPVMIEDNPEMSKKVADKEKGYTFLNFFAVIREYNTWAASKEN